MRQLRRLAAGLLLCSSAGFLVAGEELLLEADFSEPSAGAPSGWVVEGTGTAEVRDGALHLREEPDGVGMVLWSERDWPADFRLAVDLSFNNIRGIGVIFLAARAMDGGDALRDASKRTGAYNEYISGSLSSYSLSLHRYWPDGRNNPGSNLRRNSGFHLLNQALPDPCLEAQRTYHLEFVKKGARLTLKVDGTVVHDVVDTGEHGPVLGEGKIGFRLRGDSSCVMTLDSIRLWRLASCGTADSADP